MFLVIFGCYGILNTYLEERGLSLCILVRYRQTPVYTHIRATHKIWAVLCASYIPLDNWRFQRV